MSAGTRETLLAALDEAVALGALRRLDVAFARFVAEQVEAVESMGAWDASDTALAVTVLGAALVAQVEGRGHSCLPLEDAAAGAEALLGVRMQGALLAALGPLAWPTSVDGWREGLAACEAVSVEEGEGPPPGPARPLVLAGSRLYLRRYRDYERRVAQQVLARASMPAPVDVPKVRDTIDALFGGPLAPDSPFDWQRTACALALRSGLGVITGGPGTGKTYTAARLLALLFSTSPDPDRLRIALAAPTGKAAARLKQSIEGALLGLEAALGGRLPLAALASHVGAARTLHALLGARPDTRRMRHHAGHPLEVDVLIVDEASMVHLEMMAALLDALPPHARLVLLGDKDQLASVEAGAVLGDLCRDAAAGRYDAGTVAHVEAATGQSMPEERREANGPALAQRLVMLRHSQRFGGAIGTLATAVNEGRVSEAMRVLAMSTEGSAGATTGAVCWLRAEMPAVVPELALRGREGAPGGYAQYLSVLADRPPASTVTDPALQAWARRALSAFDRFRVLAAIREGAWGVAGLNRAIESALAAGGLLAPRGEWYEGRPVIVTRNDASLGVFNGDIGIALRVPVVGDRVGTAGSAGGTTALRVFFAEGDAVRSVSVGRLADVETAFAMTVHKSQGSEFDHTVLVLPPEGAAPATRELVYTGITRARTAFTLVSPSVDVFAHAIQRTTRRASGLPSWWGGEAG